MSWINTYLREAVTLRGAALQYVTDDRPLPSKPEDRARVILNLHGMEGRKDGLERSQRICSYIAGPESGRVPVPVATEAALTEAIRAITGVSV